MDNARLHPELRQAFSRIPAVPIQIPLVRALIGFLFKLKPNRVPAYPDLAVEDRALANCSVRIYKPRDFSGGAGLLWIHAGGFVMGDTGMNDRQCSDLARDLGLLVVSVEYRLAPKHPYPAAIDDCLEAWQFMQSSAGAWGLDPARIALFGQSAGGALAACLAQRIADAGGQQPAAQLLMYPALDDRTAANTELDAIDHHFWNNKNCRAAWKYYLGQAPGADSVPPYAVPARREDLSGLPPSWIDVGELDVGFDDACEYAKRLEAAGVHAEFHVTPRAPHAYDGIVPDSSVAMDTRQCYYRFLREQLKL